MASIMKQARKIPNEFAGMSSQWIRDRIYSTYLVKSWVGGNLSGDEKRVNAIMGDRRIQLWYNLLSGDVQVWYSPSNSKPYCIVTYSIQAYCYGRVVRELRERQKGAREMADDYTKSNAAMEEGQTQARRSVSREFAKDWMNIRKGKVTSSGRH